MSDPRRLISDPTATNFERSLLASWLDERPSASARAKTLAIAGVAAGATLTTAKAAASVSVAPKATGATSLVVAKWLAVAALATGAAVSGTALTRHAGRTPVAVTPATTALPKSDPAPPSNAVPEKLPPPADVAPASPTAVPHPRPARGSASTSAPLAEQIAALDRARDALSSGDSSRALKLVDAYAAKYPGGAFVQEAEVLRIDALLRRGDRANAERAAARFLAAHPESPHASRVRALLGPPPP